VSRERPILFSGPMVRAILEGRKTQTRRVVTPARILAASAVWWHGEYESVGCLQQCPYGVPGDWLWVRETWASADKWMRQTEMDPPEYIAFRADLAIYGPAKQFKTERARTDSDFRWKPSIFMPRWASRITLEVTDVRVQRVQEISEEDCIAEGIEDLGNGVGKLAHPRAGVAASYSTPRALYWRLWDSINAKRGYSWDANPWVWAIQFEVMR
jgi:hypothetical protein